MQMAVLEQQDLAGMTGAGSSEFGEPEIPLVGLTEWTGNRPCSVALKTIWVVRCVAAPTPAS